MIEEIYKRLVDVLNDRRPQLLAVPCDEFYAFARELFTPEQAEIACSMPLEPITAEGLAARMPGIVDINQLRNKLEKMANSGLVLTRQRGAEKYYELLPLAPGSLELQFIAGRSDERTKHLMLLLNKYLKAMGKELTPPPGSIPISGGKRVISLNKVLMDYLTVLPHDEVMRLIDTTSYIAAGTCTCRHGNELLGHPCDKPKNNICMVFGESAQFLADRGYVHLLSKEEARHIIEEAEKARLVHEYANDKDKGIDFLCNCCGCHCTALKGIIQSSSPSISAKANWVVTIEYEACTGCGICIDRCWTNALKIDGDTVTIDRNRCIGCGLCKDACPSDAIEIVRREIPALQS